MKHLAKLGLAALFLAHSPAVTAQSPTAAPSIVDDDVDVIPKANGKATNIDVLANDTPATDGGALKITAVFTPTSRRRRHLEEQFNIAHAIEGADSLMGGHCVPSGNKLRIKYTAPSMDYSGPDSCEYEACDENDMCGTATIHMSVNSVDAPEINDDEVTEPVSGNTFVDVLANDKAADGGGELRVESIIPPKDLWMDIPGPDGDSSPTLEDLQKLQQRRRHTRKLQHIDLVQEGAASYAGGMCYPTGNRKRVRYDPPSTTYAGADMCEYEACDENNRCGTAMIYILEVVPTETGAPTPSPGGKSRKQKPSRSSKGSKASSNAEKRNERKRMKKERKKMMHDEAESEATEGEESEKKEKKKMHAEAEAMVAAEEESEKKGRKKAMHAEAESAPAEEGEESNKKEHNKKKQKESEAADGRL